MRDKKRIPAHDLSPLRAIIIITETGPADLAVERISPDAVGWKAYGLSSLYHEWVPPFFVITASCLGERSDEQIKSWVTECNARCGIGSGQVIIRSSGTAETIQSRGRLKSESCSQSQVVSKIRRLITQLPEMPADAKVHWIVQEYIIPKRKGLLSNERRLSYENRDWVVEFEPQGSKNGYTAPVAVRSWRDGTDIIDSRLTCTTEAAIPIRLKLVAMWATQLSSRCLFEWVWDGRVIHMVQADIAEPAKGINPRSLIPARIESSGPLSLRVFRVGNDVDFRLYRKLRNAKLYEELGYSMPAFYVVDNAELVHSILTGHIPSELAHDLAELTRRPLIIRTDGLSIPAEKREMLPRSDELRSQAEATQWLMMKFKAIIEENDLQECAISLIAHHFIPSVSSAWARAEPGNRIVRIESLWGIPEGLYWYSHDTFEVDTSTTYLPPGGLPVPSDYKFEEHLRYKGTFVAPDENGQWKPFQTADKYAWRSSITKRKWLSEIAYITRQVAETETNAVAVMWFVDNHNQATKHKVLPWFHSKSELTGKPSAAPRRKRTSGKDFTIRVVDDWDRLKQELGSLRQIERVIVDPTDQELIRNLKFAEELADLASTHKVVVEFSGGILSHAYYILQRKGVQVECIDLFGADVDVDSFYKIVRDRIPEIIEGRGEHIETVTLIDDALLISLQRKIVEEAFEVLDAKSGPELIGELADVQAVIRALCRVLGIDIGEVEAEREKKEKRRGEFEKGLMLIETATPHSIRNQPRQTDMPAPELSVRHSSEIIISDPASIPFKPFYSRPDLRRVDDQIEKTFNFAGDINRIEEVKRSWSFPMPVDVQRQQEFSLGIEFSRKGSLLRGVVRLRLRRPLQLKIPFVSRQRKGT